MLCWSVDKSKSCLDPEYGWQSVSKEGPLLKKPAGTPRGNNVDKESTKPGTMNHAIPALNTIAMHLSQTMCPCEMFPPYRNLELTRVNHSTSTIDPDDMPVSVGYQCNAVQRLSNRKRSAMQHDGKHGKSPQ